VEEPQPILTDAKEAEEEEEIYQDPVGGSERIRTRLLAIATAFEILSGQGEALNIDLSDFINALFGLLRPLSLDTGIDDPTSYTPLPSNFFGRPSRFRLLVPGRLPPKTTPLSSLPTSQILLRCLHSVFFARHATNPPWRTAAFVKRLTECSLFFPPAFAKTILELVATLLSRDAKLEGLLDTEERTFDGTYKPELDDPQLVNTFATSLYEVLLIEGKYWEKSVKEEGRKLGLGNPNSVQQKM
jgi:nucleolar complex protein 3